MIPVSLKLSNFTSYGEGVPELDFTKFHLAAISGQNGAGKSSLLDAITWCVWGWSRAGDNADQLIRLGASDLFVEFSFELDGCVFTVKRSRVLTRSGSSALELWSGSTSSPQVNNLTEGTIKATQQKIIDLLHLSFETFTNSSFLRQGHADEFTTKGPTDRKRILADILGLSHYDALEEKAKIRVKQIENDLKLREYQLLEIEAELSQKEGREKSLSLAEEEARKTENQLKEVETEIKSIQQQHQTISQSIKLLEERKAQIDSIQKELTDIKLQIDLKEKAQVEFQTILNKKEEIEKNYSLLQKLTDEKKELEVKRSELIKVKDQLAAVQKTLVQREEKRAIAIKDLEIQIEKLQTENQGLQAAIDHLTKHKDTCPTCGQTIGQQKNKQIIFTNQQKIKNYNSSANQLIQQVKKYQSIILPEQKEADRLEKEVKRLEGETKDWLELSRKITELDRFQDLYTRLQQAEMGVKTHSEAVIDLQKMYRLREEQITKAQKELKQLQDFGKQLQEIKEKLEAQETIKQQLSQRTLELRGQVGEAKQLVSRTKQLEDLSKKKSQEKSALQTEKKNFEELAVAFGKRGIQAMIIETVIPEIEEEANNLLGRLTEGRMKIELRTQRETKTLRLVRLRQPQVRSGQANDEKVPGIIETLDIIISDEMGDRPYENYSGGEQFRVNMAIRLALSKLLTRRAGAKLQFLVIDEGFGTQDAQGRSKIVEVLDAIKNDFEKILIITHLDELKEEFPIRIEVSKNSAGSTFEVTGA